MADGGARAAPRRSRLSLGSRIFVMTALLILAAVGTAVALTAFLGERIARDAIREDLAASRTVQASLRDARYRQLQLASDVFTADDEVRAYIAEAGALDPSSILDLLGERQQDLGFDFAAVLDPQGRVLARTDQPAATGASLAAQPVVARAMREESRRAAGIWQEGGRMYQAVVVPITIGYELFGQFVTAVAIDDATALEIEKVSGADVAFLGRGDATPTVVATTLDASHTRGLAGALGPALARVLGGGEPVEDVTIELAGRPWLATVTPLRGAGDSPAGATVALASLDRELASYRQIQTRLLLVGAVAVLLAGALSYALSRRTVQPLRQLAAAAEAASQGNYDQEIASSTAGGRDEVGRLATAFDVLLSDLRQKRDMEAYVGELARSLPEPGGGSAPLAPPEARQVSLLGIELRRYTHPALHHDPDAALGRLAHDLRRIAAAAGAHRGKIEAVLGHRVLASFEGARRSFRALAAATEVVRSLGGRDGGPDGSLDAAHLPAVALVSGDAVVGSVVYDEGGVERGVVGLPVQQLENLLREATPGDILLSERAYEELGDAFRGAGYELPAQRGLVSTQRLYLLSPQVAAAVTGAPRAAQETAATAAMAVGGETLPASDRRATLSGVAPGAVLGDRFEVLSVLGAGGMGVVYKARDRELDEVVALKMLRADGDGDGKVLERLKSELKLARKITHPNVLRTFDFGEVGGIPYISMEFVRGVTLRYLLDQSGRLPYSAGLRLGRQLCAGLGAAHAVGVIHRDIKPENLILEQNGNLKLMDFGIARPVERLKPGQTQPGWIVGTPHYLAPEQLEGREPDQRADIYACGVVLYEVFTGALPFTAENPMQIILEHLNSPPARPSSHWPEMPPELEAILLRCLEKDRERRFATAEELGRALDGLRA
jgi:serine/threonine-protein kinase